MNNISQSPRNWTATDAVQQRPRAVATYAKVSPHCANLAAHGAIPAQLSQAVATHALLTLAAEPQRLEASQTNANAGEIRQTTTAVFNALGKCEANSNKIFNAKNTKSDNAAWRNAQSNNRNDFKAWRDSPDGLPKAEMEKREAAGRVAYNKIKSQKSYTEPGPKKLLEILKQNVAFERKLDPNSNGFRDVNTGLYCELHQTNTDSKNPEYVLCFPGTGAAAMDRMQWLNNIDQAIGTGAVPPAYQQAAELTEFIKTALDKSGAKLIVSGHSMGGGIANYVGLKHDLSSVCYNAAPLGGACLQDLGSIPKDRLEKQLHIRCKGDLVSSPKVQQKLQSFLQVWNKEKIWVPRNAGTICEVGKDYAPEKGAHDRHLLSIFDTWYDPIGLAPKVNINLLQMA